MSLITLNSMESSGPVWGDIQGRNLGARKFKCSRLQNKEENLKRFLRSSVIREEVCSDERTNVVPYSYFCHGLRNLVLVLDIPAAPVFAFYCSPCGCKIFGLTYLLTPWCRVLLEKLTGLQLVKKFPAFYGTRRFITALTSVHHLSLSWASPIQSTYPHPTSWRSILILSTHLRK